MQAQQQAQMQAQHQAQMQAQQEAARKSAEAEQQRIAAEKERARQEAIQAENQRAAAFRSSSEINLQKNLQNQQSQQGTQNAPQTGVGDSGYNIATVQQQKVSAAGGVGGVSGPASANVGTGGTQQQSNSFSLPTTTGLQFGGM